MFLMLVPIPFICIAIYVIIFSIAISLIINPATFIAGTIWNSYKRNLLFKNVISTYNQCIGLRTQGFISAPVAKKIFAAGLQRQRRQNPGYEVGLKTIEIINNTRGGIVIFFTDNKRERVYWGANSSPGCRARRLLAELMLP